MEDCRSGQLVECSNAFYSSAWNLIMPGRPASMADGWENSRRRDGGYDYVTFGLAAAGVVGPVEIDATYFVGNAPGPPVCSRLFAIGLTRSASTLETLT